MWEAITDFFEIVFGEESPYRGPILSVVTIIVMYLVYRVSRKAILKYLTAKPHKQENIQNFLFLYRYIWLALVVILAIISLSGSIAALGVSAAFLGMILGWSLQAPVTGIAAWLMIVTKRPFKIGDRVIIAGITGDVTDINLTHIVMNQVGGTVSGEDKSGRGVMIPTAMLFQQIIYNYHFESKYLLDEVPVLITYESDVDLADQICLDAAKTVLGNITGGSKSDPYSRLELADSGIRVRLRYQTLAVERQRISSNITREIIIRFNATEKVEFAYPHMEVLHRQKMNEIGGEA